MVQITQYSSKDKMSSLISGDDTLLQVLACFGISLGFGDRTVDQVCKLSNVDCATFLTVVNFVTSGFSSIETHDHELSLPCLITYLRQTHIYYLDNLLPSIREKLVKATSLSKDKVGQLIIKAFDEYMREIKKHMDYEDQTVFIYVENLLKGEQTPTFKIKTYSKHHDLVGERLTELKSIIIKYTPADVDNYMLMSALLDIFECEKGLEWHCKIEDYLFSPLVLNYEQKLIKNED
ncbi:hemerythrin domain-containing protein [Bacteroides propionicifaciens]|uniref:hemerythrin domain-containing protein n=1 Tax=Bacteroides propionicifaciens TaxID=392838 RepID=UPI0003772E1C|nr:hemerythrin domain-containing protein [Bacteroides propionicifaciens]